MIGTPLIIACRWWSTRIGRMVTFSSPSRFPRRHLCTKELDLHWGVAEVFSGVERSEGIPDSQPLSCQAYGIVRSQTGGL